MAHFFSNRGAIHAHMLQSYPHGISVPEMKQCFDNVLMPTYGVTDALNRCNERLASKEFVQKGGPEVEAEKENKKKFEEDLELMKAICEAKKKAKNFFVNELGISEVHSNMAPNSWKPPYGNNYVEPEINVLRQHLEEKMESSESLQNALERLLNRVQTHSCTYK